MNGGGTHRQARLSTLFLSTVIALAVVGYLVGIRDGKPRPREFEETTLVTEFDQEAVPASAKLIPSISYREVPDTPMGPTAAGKMEVQSLPVKQHDLFSPIDPNEADKLASAALRASRRAYNGAPPMIPHRVENTTDAACYACHGPGVEMGGVKASVMSHEFLANCTQCHAPPAPGPFGDLAASVASSFAGLAAPTAGIRAYPGAPPTIPHSRWMRENCNACHGGPYGWAGMESTHPWRTNCTQCHAPSAILDQMPESESVPMLAPLEVVATP